MLGLSAADAGTTPGESMSARTGITAAIGRQLAKTVRIGIASVSNLSRLWNAHSKSELHPA
ncbi:MAG TPA: hypothetical protein VL132_12990 [Planctomycetaceae bacterium]|nr:hypothetical protein [Planctomycetaceae bacterium]